MRDATKATIAAPVSTTTPAKRTDETCALVLQGGGALGSYQAGVYEQMAAHGLRPNWVAGVSIGAINAAIIAGNPPEHRVQKLHAFWDLVTEWYQFIQMPGVYGTEARELLNTARAQVVASFGVPGFFEPRVPPASMQWPGMRGALSLYDTAPLEHTLENLIDFDLVNTRDVRHKVRLSIGAVNVMTGNDRYFDSSHPERCGPITVRHVMASGAMPPGFPPIQIDDEYYWDGGLVSNTPLGYVLAESWDGDLLVLQVDLFSARGNIPRDLNEVAAREKDIRYASRTRLTTDRIRRDQIMGVRARRLAARLPPSLRNDPDIVRLSRLGSPGQLTIMHLIYRSERYETQSKDYEFSRQTMIEHWRKGADDARVSLDHRDFHTRRRSPDGVTVLDLTPQLKLRPGAVKGTP